VTAGDHAELDLLDTLERGLSSAYTLFQPVTCCYATLGVREVCAALTLGCLGVGWVVAPCDITNYRGREGFL